MAYNILSINPGHNGSVSLLSDGKLAYYIEEERLSRMKRDGNPFRAIIDVCSKYKIDELLVTGIHRQPLVVQTLENMFHCLVRKYNPQVKFLDFSNKHHLSHISNSFYNSRFNRAVGIVIDGNGSCFNFNNEKVYETESYWYCTYPFNFIKLGGRFISSNLNTKNTKDNIKITTDVTIGKQYEAVTKYLGFNDSEEGKTMGLSSYGKESKTIPSILNTPISSSFKSIKYPDGIFGEYIYPLENTLQNKKNLAWRIQNDTQQLVGDYIEKAIEKTGLKQVCCGGGYFLNCVTNYYLKKRFPQLNFYFDPISHDGGTSLGVALYRWAELGNKIIPKKTLYYGPQYSKEQLLEGIKKYVSN